MFRIYNLYVQVYGDGIIPSSPLIRINNLSHIMNAPPPSSLSPSLTQRLIAMQQRPVDLRSRRRALLHWLDWMGCVAAGANAPATQKLRSWKLFPQASVQGEPVAIGLLGSFHTPMQALMAEAGAANIEEMDDMHRTAVLHPGPVILPAVACFAREQQFTAGQLLDAIVRGYETMIRIGRAVGLRHYFYWHNTATAGAFGAASACSDLLQLSDEARVWALGNAGTQAAGLWQVRLEPVMSKQLHTGHAAWAGLSAASLAAAGFTGPRQILEGERGFFAAMCIDGSVDRVCAPEADWLIHDTSFKPWPACRHTHATIDATLALRESLGDDAFAFTHALVESFDDALNICNNAAPATRTEAKFSLQYAVAAAARFGALQPHHFDEACWSEPGLRAAAGRVELGRSTEFQAAYPAHYGARVTLSFADGRMLSHAVRDALGDPERALDAEAVQEKMVRLMSYGGVAPERIEALLNAARILLEDESSTHMDEALPQAFTDPLF